MINSSKKANIMKKNYLYLILLLLSNLLVIGQTVTLTPTSVNGVSVSAGPINLGSTPNSTISLSANVQFPAGAAVGDQGTIIIYFSGAGLGTNTALGGNGGALYFGGGQSAARSFTINLDWTAFQTSGGYIYAEYKNGATYKSTNISVIKNATMNTGTNLNPPADAPNPSNIANTLCCNQTIRLGDKPAPITGSKYLNPYQNEPYGINSSWNIGTSNILDIDGINSILTLDYMTELNSFTVTRSLGYRYKLDFPNKSNTITINVVPSPIIGNEISIATESSPNSDGFVEIINTNPKQIFGLGSSTYVDLDILADPNYVQQGRRTTNTAPIERYEWQYTKTDIKGYFTNQNWITIKNEFSSTLKYFTPESISNTEDNYFLLRRIAIYKNISRVSNTLKILYRKMGNNNIICCDQVLAADTSTKQIEKPSLILGSSPSFENLSLDDKKYYLRGITYQWQSLSISNTRSNTTTNTVWSNIEGANSKDYLPLPLQYIVGTRGGLEARTTYYRRIAIIDYAYTTDTNPIFSYGKIKSYSNEINVESGTLYGSPTLIVYPNPATSIMYIENKETAYNLTNAKISIINMMGIVVNTNNFSVINPNLISIDVSNLIIGTYFINIVTDSTGKTGLNTQIGFIKSN